MKGIKHQWAGADWLVKSGYAKGGIGRLGRNVADLLGYLDYGLYHMDGKSLGRADWANEHFIQVTIRDFGPATFDGDYLTRLVVICHEMEIRCAISPAGPRGMRLFFSPRHGREGNISERHPAIEDAVALVRGHVAIVEAEEAKAP